MKTMLLIDAGLRMRQNRARWLCDKHGITEEEGYLRTLAALTNEEYMERVQPLLKMKADVLRFKMTRYWLHLDGRIEVRPIDYTMEERTFLAQIDELIAGVQRDLGIE